MMPEIDSEEDDERATQHETRHQQEPWTVIPACDRKSMVPFGCFLALGAVVAIAAGREILDWYLGTFA